MKIVSNWHRIVTRAWSIRLMILAGLLTGLETILPNITGLTDRQFSALNFAVVAGAFVARLVVQKKVSGDGE